MIYFLTVPDDHTVIYQCRDAVKNRDTCIIHRFMGFWFDHLGEFSLNEPLNDQIRSQYGDAVKNRDSRIIHRFYVGPSLSHSII